MGEVRPVTPGLFFVAAFSRFEQALDDARDWVQRTWGAIALESPLFAFTETDYYDREMGVGLNKVLFALEGLRLPDQLPAWKLQSNQQEAIVAASGRYAADRPLNLDPGYLTESKLVLASTKDHAHRLYLSDGIYAEITLRYHKHHWVPWEWTYPDYRRSDYHAYFDRCREYLRSVRGKN